MATPTRPVVYPTVLVDTLDRLMKLLERAAPLRGVDRTRLEEDLLSVLYATGTAHDGSAEAEMWREALGAAPNHKALALGYRRMAEAPDPLDPAVCAAELRSGLNQQVYVRWTSRWRKEGRGERASLRAVTWATLSPEEQEEIRAMARHLETCHRTHVKKGRPTKDDLDTLLTLLASLFAQHSGYESSHHELPHAVESRFIRFAALALASFYDPSEVSQIALANRWERLKPAAARRTAIRRACAERQRRRQESRPGPPAA